MAVIAAEVEKSQILKKFGQKVVKTVEKRPFLAFLGLYLPFWACF